MFDFNNTEIPTALDKRISELLVELENLTGDPDAYATVTTSLAKLMDLRNNALKTQNEKTKVENEQAKINIDQIKIENDHSTEKEKINIEKEKITIEQQKLELDDERFNAEQEKQRSWKPSPDAVVGAAASVVGILLVLHYEKIGVVTSKALGFVSRMTK